MSLCRAPTMKTQSLGASKTQKPRAVVVPRAAASAVSSVHHPSPIIMNGQVLHSLTPARLEVIKSMDQYLIDHVVPLLKPTEKHWQPSDYLPESSDPDFLDKVRELRERAQALPDEWLVCFVGDMITEEALPTYMTMINTLDGVRDETGASQTPWAKWTREWTAEENRHGDLMNKYMYLTGRVNMKSVDWTIQNLIGSGMDPKTENNPYLGFTYTSFQERATKISHGNTARKALECGDTTLAKLSGMIAADEGRHEIAYQRIVEYFLEHDPEGGMLAYGDMMKKQIVMPAHYMNDNTHSSTNKGRNLFADFSAVAERSGVYTPMDYADIMDYLNRKWRIAERSVSGQAAEYQEFVLTVPDRLRKLHEKHSARKNKTKPVKVQFGWVFNREVTI